MHDTEEEHFDADEEVLRRGREVCRLRVHLRRLDEALPDEQRDDERLPEGKEDERLPSRAAHVPETVNPKRIMYCVTKRAPAIACGTWRHVEGLGFRGYVRGQGLGFRV